MSDIQFRNVHRQNRFDHSIALGLDIPDGTAALINKKYKEWLIRRGMADSESLNSFAQNNARRAQKLARRTKALSTGKTDRKYAEQRERMAKRAAAKKAAAKKPPVKKAPVKKKPAKKAAKKK